MEIYRVVFETVIQSHLAQYCNADPTFYKNVTQTVPNSQIPDESWYEVKGHETDSPWQQYNQLKKWDRADEQFVRNIRLQKLVSAPSWEEIPDPHAGS
jgi:hypothetical protein